MSEQCKSTVACLSWKDSHVMLGRNARPEEDEADAWKDDSCNGKLRVRDGEKIEYHLFPLRGPLLGETNGCRNHNAVPC